MKAAGPLLALVCGVMVLVGLFLPWMSINLASLGMVGDDYYASTAGNLNYSGWDFIRYSFQPGFGADPGDVYYQWLVLIGAIIMIGSTMTTFSIYQRRDQIQFSGTFSNIAAFIGALLAIIGTMTYISDASKANAFWSMMGEGSGINLTGAGVILSAVFAFLGIICVMMMFVLSRMRPRVTDVSENTGRLADIVGTSSTTSGSVREYYENKAADFGKDPAPVQQQTPPAAVPPVSTAAPPPLLSQTAPLPLLPPVIDDAAAQECFVRAGELETAGERDKSVEQYTKAIRLNAKYTTAYFKRGMLLMEMGFKPAAVADFRRVIDIADNPELTDIAKANIVKLG